MKWTDKLENIFRSKRNEKQESINQSDMHITHIVQPLPIKFNLNALVIADTHGCLGLDEISYSPSTDVCLLLGDFSKEDILIIKEQVIGIPIYGVLGNHDGFDLYERYGIENIHGKVVEVKGVKIAGLQGSLRYKDSDMPLYTDDESVEIAEGIGEADILISHDSPKFLHSDQDFAHSGLQGIMRYCEKYNVPLNIHGHHHDPKECVLNNGTRTICCYKAQIVSISPNECIVHHLVPSKKEEGR